MANDMETSHLYEIFKACRLCGAMRGYKMPIIQSVFGFESSDIEIQTKIRECVQIEVKEDDKMPPLICELCANKVSSFYDFLETCRLTDRVTRQRLGLELPHKADSVTSSDECILGITEPVLYLTGPKTRPGPKSKTKICEPDITKTKPGPASKTLDTPTRPGPASKTIDTPTRPGPASKTIDTPTRPGPKSKTKITIRNEVSLPKPGPKSKTRNPVNEVSTLRSGTSRIDLDTEVQKSGKKSDPRIKGNKLSEEAAPKMCKKKCSRHSTSKELNELKKDLMLLNLDDSKEPRVTRGRESSSNTSGNKGIETDSLPITRLREQTKNTEKPKVQDTPKTNLRKLKDVEESEDDLPLATPRAKRGCVEEIPAVPLKKTKGKSSAQTFNCSQCNSSFRSASLLNNHIKTRHVGFTPIELACNACRDWFPSKEESDAHHAWHLVQNKQYRCQHCSRRFRTHSGFNQHLPCVRFPVKLQPPVSKKAKCEDCSSTFASLGNLKRHVKGCYYAKIRNAMSSPETIAESMLPMEVRLVRCDDVLPRGRSGKWDVGRLGPMFGLDRKRVYPYLEKYNTKIKKEKLDSKQDRPEKKIAEVLYREEDYVHWDSDLSSDSDTDSCETVKRKVDRLSTLSLKTIFSKRCLGKVPRKVRKVKTEKVFDNLFSMDGFSAGISNLIDSLGVDDDGVGKSGGEVNVNDDSKGANDAEGAGVDAESVDSASLIDNAAVNIDNTDADDKVRVDTDENRDNNNEDGFSHRADVEDDTKSEDAVSVASASLVDNLATNVKDDVGGDNNSITNADVNRRDLDSPGEVDEAVNDGANDDKTDICNENINSKGFTENSKDDNSHDLFEDYDEKNTTAVNDVANEENEENTDNNGVSGNDFTNSNAKISKNYEEFTIDALLGKNDENTIQETDSCNIFENIDNGNVDGRNSNKNSDPHFENGMEKKSEMDIDSDTLLKDIDAQLDACETKRADLLESGRDVNTSGKQNAEFSSLSLDDVSNDEFNFDT